MSERDIVERIRAEIGGGQLLSWCRPKSALEACAEILRLRAELATARREGWIAGRDAAAECALNTFSPTHTMASENAEIYAAQDRSVDLVVVKITALEPPA